jgi:glutathione synthase/RimK-type ligase-like ATP-grasp enzyme
MEKYHESSKRDPAIKNSLRRRTKPPAKNRQNPPVLTQKGLILFLVEEFVSGGIGLKTLGIMVHRIKNPDKFLPYHNVAVEEGFDGEVVYTPDAVDLRNGKIDGYVYRNGGWSRASVPFPTISHDIGYYSGSRTLAKVRSVKKSMRFVESLIGNKWSIQKHLMRFEAIRSHLIPTLPLRHVPVAMNMVKKYGSVMLKPIFGKMGRDIFRLGIAKPGFYLKENGKPARRYSREECKRAVAAIQQKRKYLVQKWLDLRNQNGNVYDVRVVMQKERQGNWTFIGMGIREGGRGKITSNLKSGGRPFEVQSYLEKQFGKVRTEEICAKIKDLSAQIPDCLERSYNKRLAELGLDLAIDRDGHIWFIEANSKPGRTILRTVCNMKAAEERIRCVIQYASSLCSLSL